MSRKENIVGKKFKGFTVLELSDKQDNNNDYLWKCRCECGEIRYLTTQKAKNQKSCGCKRKTANNMSGTKLYNIWNNMKQRCNNPNSDNYKYYGNKGIKVCDEWNNSFIPFYEWSMANGYRDGLSIDRKDTNKDYEPSNCRWINLSENVAKSNNEMSKIYTYNGKSMTLKEWSKELGIKQKTLYERLRKGWSIEETLSIKLGGRR